MSRSSLADPDALSTDALVVGSMSAFRQDFGKIADNLVDHFLMVIEAELTRLGLQGGQQRSERLRQTLRDIVVEKLLDTLRHHLAQSRAVSDVIAGFKVRMG